MRRQHYYTRPPTVQTRAENKGVSARPCSAQVLNSLAQPWRDGFQLLSPPFSYSVTVTFNDYVTNITRYDNPDRTFAKKYYEGSMRWGEIGYGSEDLFASDDGLLPVDGR